MKILVTGAAGFIGSHIMARLARRGDEVTGIDSLNSYYDPRLKVARLAACGLHLHDGGVSTTSSLWPNCRFQRMSVEDSEAMSHLFAHGHFEAVVHLAAQAGVRYSVTNPQAYIESNIDGFLQVLEGCRRHEVRRLVFASSSSVYGMSAKAPFRESEATDAPRSLYAASKKSDELMAYSYSSLYGIKATALRYFTVYGPWGRPDMAPSLFAHALIHGQPLRLFNYGNMLRDFTFIDDIVEGTLAVLDREPHGQEGQPDFRVYNIGSANPVKLLDFVHELETALDCKGHYVMLPMQPGDVYETYADTSLLLSDTGFAPRTPLAEGLKRFVEWYRSDKNPLEHEH